MEKFSISDSQVKKVFWIFSVLLIFDFLVLPVLFGYREGSYSCEYEIINCIALTLTPLLIFGFFWLMIWRKMSDIANIANSTELARRLTLLNPDGSLMRGPFTIYEFDSPKSGIASPVFRENTGFVSTGTGKTAGGAREFVIPNFEKNTLNNLIEREVK